MGYMPIMWTDTKKSEFLSGLRVPDSWLATEKPVCLSDFGCRSVGGQQKNQSLKEGVICYGRGTFLLNLPKCNRYKDFNYD